MFTFFHDLSFLYALLKFERVSGLCFLINLTWWFRLMLYYILTKTEEFEVYRKSSVNNVT